MGLFILAPRTLLLITKNHATFTTPLLLRTTPLLPRTPHGIAAKTSTGDLHWTNVPQQSNKISLLRLPRIRPGVAPLFRTQQADLCRSRPPASRPVSRSYARDRSNYNMFGNGRPGDEEFRNAWAKDVDEEDCLWTGSDEDEDNEKKDNHLEKEIKKIKAKARENSNLVDGDDSDELRSICSESDEEKTLWSGSECDDDDDIPSEAHPNERSDPYIDKLFEFEEMPQYRTIAELLKAEKDPPELSPGKQARKLAVENALKKLKKGPDGRYTNVWDVISDVDILIGAFENIISGPEYAELRAGGPKKLDMQFFKGIQTRMRDPNFKFSPELKLKPKSKLVPRKKWQKSQSRRRKSERR